MSNEPLERRSQETAISTSDNLTVEGYAVVFDSPSIFAGNQTWDYEVIDPHALDNCDMSECVFRYNHSDADPLLARVSNDTLKLEIDERGLKIRAALADTQQGRDLYTLIQRRDVSAMSFGMIVAESHIEYRVRHIDRIKKLVDVSAVDNPAYKATSLDVVKRSIDSLKAEHDTETRKRISLLNALF